MGTQDCKKITKLIQAHFSGQILPGDEKILRSHLPDCATCRKSYQHHLLLSRLDPQAMTAQERLAKGLGLEPRRRNLAFAVAALSLATTAAVILLIVLAGPTRISKTPDADFVARGTTPHQSSTERLTIYRIHQGREPQRVTEEILSTDELAFAYKNPGGKKRLLVFGVDEQQRIFWYHPEWRAEEQNPEAVSIEPGAELKELPEAISHELAGKVLILHAIFTDRMITVKEIEKWLMAEDRSEPPFSDQDTWLQTRLKVRHLK